MEKDQIKASGGSMEAIPEKKTKGDHILAGIKAAIELVPHVGGAIASLIGDYVPSSTQRAIIKAFEHLRSRLEQLEQRVSTDNLDNDQFAELFKSCYLVIIRSNHEKKLHAAAELLINILLREGEKEKLPYEELDHFVRCVDSLSRGAIEVIGVAYEIVKPQIKSNQQTYGYGYRLDFRQIQERVKKVNPMESSLLMGLIGELNSMNLLHIAGIPQVRDRDYASYPIEFTPLGLRFVTYILRQSS